MGRSDRTRIKYRTTFVPYGKGFKRTEGLPALTDDDLKKYETVDQSTVFKDQYKQTAIAFFKGVLDTKDVQDTKIAAASLLANIVPEVSGTSLHLGDWRKTQKYIFRSSDTINSMEYYDRVNRKPFWENKATTRVIQKVDQYFKRTAPNLCDDYRSIKHEDRLFGLSYLMCVINIGGTGPHYDKKDEIEGLCCVIPMGTFDGGDLVFRQQKLRFPIRSGDIIFFRSRELMHENLPVTSGNRYSLVLTTDHDSFTEYGQTVVRRYFSWKQPVLKARKRLKKEGVNPKNIPDLRIKVAVNDVYKARTRANTPLIKFKPELWKHAPVYHTRSTIKDRLKTTK